MKCNRCDFEYNFGVIDANAITAMEIHKLNHTVEDISFIIKAFARGYLEAKT